jgi:hypothetical protein
VPVVDVGAVGALLHDPPGVALAELRHGVWGRLGFGRARFAFQSLDLRVRLVGWGWRPEMASF